MSLLNFRQTKLNIFRLSLVQFVLDYSFVYIYLCVCPGKIKVQLHLPVVSIFRLLSRLEDDEGLPAAGSAAAALLR